MSELGGGHIAQDGKNFFNLITDGVRPNYTMPNANDFLIAATTTEIMFICLAAAACLGCIVLAMVHLFFLVTMCTNENLRTNLYFVALMIPITSVCAVIGMCIPRSAHFLYGVNSAYYSLVMYLMIRVMFDMFGSRNALRRYMLKNNIEMNLNVPFYLHYLHLEFLPKIAGNARNLRIMEALVMQTVAVRIVIMVVEVVVLLELNHRDHIFFIISQGFNIVSMLAASYAISVLQYLGKEHLQPFRYNHLFILVDWTQMVVVIEKIAVDIIVGAGFIKTDTRDKMNATGKAMLYFYSVAAMEMFLVSIYTTVMFRPSRTLIFNLAHEEDSSSLDTAMEPLNVVQPSAKQERFSNGTQLRTISPMEQRLED